MAGTRSDQTSRLDAVSAATGLADFHRQPIGGANQWTAKNIKVPQIKVLWGGGLISWCSEYTRTHTHLCTGKLFLITGFQARNKCKAACPVGPTLFFSVFSVIHRQSDGHTCTPSVCVTTGLLTVSPSAPYTKAGCVNVHACMCVE